MKILHSLFVFVLISILTSCASSLVAPIKKEVVADGKIAQTLFKQAQHGNGALTEEHKPSVEFVDTIWLPTSKEADIKMKEELTINLQRSFEINRAFKSLQEIAERFTFKTAIPTYVSADVGVSALPTPPKQSVPGVAGPLPSLQSNQLVPQIAPEFLKYSGNIEGFLNLVAVRYGISWEWADKRINFFRYTTKTFKIVALPGDTQMNALVTNQVGSGASAGSGAGNGAASGGAGAGGGGSSNSTAATSSTGISYSGMSVWTAIDASIKGMLSKGGNVVVTPATSSVTVTDTPAMLDRIKLFIDAQNESLSMQVVVNVKVLSVDLYDNDEYGLNLSALYSSLSGNFGMGLSNAFTTGTGDSNLAVKVLGIPGSGVPGNGKVKAWQGSQAIIAALSKQGHVSQITSSALITLNNQVAPIQVGTQTAFLASSATTLAASVGSTTTLTPGMFTTGFSMTMVPNILDRTRLLLQYNINISSLISLTQASSNGSSIQTPSLATRNFLQRVMLNTGDTLVMTGFEQENKNSSSQGVGSANNLALGGGVDATKSRSVMVILIQPILGDNH